MSSDLVSVIMIFLNAGRFLPEAIESVFAQTHRSWELLLVDDGSTDASRDIASTCAARHPQQVRYLEHDGRQNRGMSASRNLGIHHARGEYVAFLDADDVWLPDKLAEQVAILRSGTDLAMVFGPVQWWYSWTGDSNDAARDFTSRLPFVTDKPVQPPDLLIPLLTRETVTTTPGLIRRNAILAVGGFEESFRGLYEDQAFFVKMCMSSSIYVSRRCWYKWRKHSDSACSEAVTDGRYRAARLAFLLWLQNYLRERQQLSAEVSRIVKAELWKCRHPFINRMWSRVRRP